MSGALLFVGPARPFADATMRHEALNLVPH
jgi:hypothetical protein